MSVQAETGGSEELRLPFATTDDLVRVTSDDVSVTVEGSPREGLDVAAPSAANARARVAVGIAIGDVVAFLLAVIVSDVLRGVEGPTLVFLALPVPLWLALVGAFSGTSSSVIAGRLGFARIAGGTGILGCGVAMIAGGTPGFGTRIAAFVGLLLVLDVAQRLAWSIYARGRRRNGELRLRAVLVGTGDEPSDFVDLIRSEASDLLPVGRLVIRDEKPVRDALPTYTHLSDVAVLAVEGSVDCLLVASSVFDREELAGLRRFARMAGLHLRLFTKAPEALGSHLDVSPLGPGALVTVRPAKLNGIQAVIKRGMDIVGAAIGLILAAPLFAVIAPLVKLTSPGPVLFRQNRVTRGGRVFRIAKFRTMVTDVDRILAEHGIDPTQPFFKPKEDILVTKVGRFLRATSLDELPQLWNVLVGQMSLVGPRPLPEDQVLANPELLESRHDVCAGVTGWWQVNGRSDVAPGEAVRQDLFYIENWSVGLDVRILAKTAGVLVSRRGAY